MLLGACRLDNVLIWFYKFGEPVIAGDGIWIYIGWEILSVNETAKMKKIFISKKCLK